MKYIRASTWYVKDKFFIIALGEVKKSSVAKILLTEILLHTFV